MQTPEQSSSSDKFVNFEDLLESPSKLKNDQQLSTQERISHLSDWLYNQYLAFDSTETIEDEEKLLNQLIKMLNQHKDQNKRQYESLMKELRWLFNSYWSLALAGGIGIGTTFYLLTKDAVELMIPANVFLNQRSWQVLTESSTLTKVLNDAQSDLVLNKFLIGMMAYAVAISIGGMGLISNTFDPRRGSVYGVRSSWSDIRNSEQQMKNQTHDLMYLLGVDESLQLNSTQILAAAQIATKRINRRKQIQQQRNDITQRRRHLLDRAGISHESKLWDRADDFTESVEAESDKTLRGRR